MVYTGIYINRYVKHESIKPTADLIKAFSDRENYAQKYQLIKFLPVDNFVNWFKDSRKDDYYSNEEGLYELISASQQPKANDFRKHCCNVMFPHIWQEITKKIEKDYQEATEEKNAALTLLNDGLQEQGNRIKGV